MTDRAVSAVLGYIMMLGILTLLVSGIFLSAGNYVENQQERVIRSEFNVLGNRLAADIAAIDRLALASNSGGKATLVTNLPPRAAGKTYEVTISPVAGSSNVYHINLSANKPSVDVTVKVKAQTPIVTSTVGGGEVQIRFNGTHIEVERA